MLINRKSLAKLMTSIGTLGVINMFKNILCMLLLIIGSNQAWAADDYVVYYHNDALGSPVAATNEQGNVIWKEHYHPYGEKAVNDQKSFNEKLGYTGKSFDRSTGLSYYGARYYDPVIGRFMGIDPVGFQEGNVHSFNRYAYANNNPLVFIDPDGRSPKYIGPMKRIHTMGGPGFSGGGGGMRPPGWGATRSGGGGMVSKAAVNKGMNTSFRRARMTDGNGNVMPSATKKLPDTLKPGPFAKESIPAHRGRPTAAEQRQVNDLMDKHGCHTCGKKNPGTKSGNAVADHQPAQALGEPKKFFPHCINCARRQGGQVRQQKRKGGN